jgi:hypothetical protein
VGLFLIRSNYIEQLDRKMSKKISPNESSGGVQPSVVKNPSVEVALNPFWLLNAGSAKKLGQHSAGILNYHVLADNDRHGLLLAVTRNEGGGYYSRERVPFRTIVKCLDKYKSGVPFVSKVLKDVFVSKSANNAGFMAAVLRALGLLAAAPEAQTQHVVTGDWLAWEKATLAETGTRIELPAEIGGEKPGGGDTVPEGKEHKKTLQIPAKKP